jgi:hypothetical protein
LPAGAPYLPQLADVGPLILLLLSLTGGPHPPSFGECGVRGNPTPGRIPDNPLRAIFPSSLLLTMLTQCPITISNAFMAILNFDVDFQPLS